MAEDWMPGATRLDIGDHARCDGGEAKAIPHITWDRNATQASPADLVSYETLVNYFGRNAAGKAAAPHVLWDPFTGRITQFHPAWSRSKSLADNPNVGTRTNRAGSVVIQIEALFFPYCRVNGRVYARLVDTPCKGWAELNAWVRSHGVPDRWPMGRPFDFTPHRNEQIWEDEGGWYAHAHVPENDHQDPGSWPSFINPNQEEEDMTPEQAKQLAEIHAYLGWNYKGKGSKTDAYADLKAATAQATAAAKNTAGLGAKVDAIKLPALTDAQVVKVAETVASSPALAEKIAELVAAKLSKRLES